MSRPVQEGEAVARGGGSKEHASRGEVVMEALRWFKRQHGHLKVPVQVP